MTERRATLQVPLHQERCVKCNNAESRFTCASAGKLIEHSNAFGRNTHVHEVCVLVVNSICFLNENGTFQPVWPQYAFSRRASGQSNLFASSQDVFRTQVIYHSMARKGPHSSHWSNLQMHAFLFLCSSMVQYLWARRCVCLRAFKCTLFWHAYTYICLQKKWRHRWKAVNKEAEEQRMVSACMAWPLRCLITWRDVLGCNRGLQKTSLSS